MSAVLVDPRPIEARLPTLSRFRPRSRPGVWWPAIFVFAFYRLIAVVGITPERFYDSETYEQGISLLGPSQRLWVVPTMFAAVPFDGLRVVVHAGIGAVCWCLLATAIARCMHNVLLGRCATCAVLGLGATVQVTQWDLAILSESLAISFTALLVAVALRHTWDPSVRSLAALGVAVVLWTFTRQSHVIVLALLVGGLAVSLFWRRGRRSRASALAVLAVVLIWGLTSLRGNEQFTFNSLAIIANRIYVDEKATEYFADRGMPTNEDSVAGAGLFNGLGAPVLEDEQLIAWVEDEWRFHYPLYLLRQVPASIREPLLEAPGLLSIDPNYARPRRTLPAPLGEMMYGTSAGDLIFWWGIGGALLLRALLDGRRQLAAIAMVVTTASGLAYLVTWHLTGTELARLVIVPSVGLRIGLLLCVVEGVDAVSSAARVSGRPS